jgi:16S rRNA (cytosine967-C5)-methyltransferase
MTPDARIKATIELLGHIAKSPVPMDTTVGDYMRGRRYIGARDRANIAERVYDIVRARARLGWWLEKTGARDTPRNRVILWLALAELKSGVFDIAELFAGGKYGAEKLTGEELELAASLKDKPLDDPEMPLAVRVECPPDYEEWLRAAFGGDFEIEMRAMIAGATLDLRVNTAKASREEVQAALEKDRVPTDPTPYAASGLRARHKAYLAKTKAFVKGWIDIQDEGSQLTAQICAARPGMQVIDYCAGAGGKTLALADAMRNKGRIVAMDTDSRRLEKARPRFKRAGVSDIIEVRALDDERSRKWLKRQKGTFDLVLADVPCTGSGTWRRNPDMRWRTYGPPLEALLAVQAEILDRVARTLKPGGRLVYATCSLLPEENERQIEAFRQRHPDFEPVVPDAPGTSADNPYLRLTPFRHNTDGFFAAVLEKRSPVDPLAGSAEHAGDQQSGA